MKKLIAYLLLLSVPYGCLGGDWADKSITNLSGNGKLTFNGGQPNTMAVVEWKAALGDTNDWQQLKTIYLTNSITTTEVPMFFRIRYITEATVSNGLVSHIPLSHTNHFDVVSGKGCSGLGTLGGSLLGEARDRFGDLNGAGTFTTINGYGWVAWPTVGVIPDSRWYSISLWFCVASQVTDTCWFASLGINDGSDGSSSRTNGFCLGYRGTDTNLLFISGNSSEGVCSNVVSCSIETFQWHNLIGIWDDGVSRVWLDGHRVNIIQHHPFLLNVPQFEGVVWLRGHFDGFVDDLRIYNRALTDDEAKLIYVGF